MTEQELLDEGYGLWYIIREHTNQRFVNGSYEPFIYNDIDAAKDKAAKLNSGVYGNEVYLPIMVKDYNSMYKKHMDTRPKILEHDMDDTVVASAE